MRKFIIAIFFLLGIILLAQNCAPHGGEHTHGHHGVMDKIKEHQEELDYAINATNLLDTNYLIKVHATVPAVKDFLTEKKLHKLTSFPCSNCHSKSLKEMQANRAKAIKKAHWDIQLAHADESVMNCTTCHSKNNMNELITLSGQPLQINESYKLCGQCHSTQKKDWEGGAHGKQLNGWKPPRVAKTCVSCHNPHHPSFPSRFPARLNTNSLEKE